MVPLLRVMCGMIMVRSNISQKYTGRQRMLVTCKMEKIQFAWLSWLVSFKKGILEFLDSPSCCWAKCVMNSLYNVVHNSKQECLELCEKKKFLGIIKLLNKFDTRHWMREHRMCYHLNCHTRYYAIKRAVKGFQWVPNRFLFRWGKQAIKKDWVTHTRRMGCFIFFPNVLNIIEPREFSLFEYNLWTNFSTILMPNGFYYLIRKGFSLKKVMFVVLV